MHKFKKGDPVCVSNGEQEPPKHHRKKHRIRGMLGYEAVVCTECGRYGDQAGLHEADSWSLDLIGKRSVNEPNAK